MSEKPAFPTYFESFGKVAVERLYVHKFRNIESALVEPALRLNVFFGDNGHGKTSLIEALYVLATTRSFRAAKLGETILEGSPQAELGAKVKSLGLSRELRARLTARGRSFLLDGKSPKRRLDYALSTPIIAFHPGDLFLVSGAAGLRRNLLDRVMVYLDPPGSEARLRYQDALRKRQKLLEERGTKAKELDSYEAVLAEHGARLSLGRERAAEQLMEALVPAFVKMGAPGLVLKTKYEPKGTIDVARFCRELAESRGVDLRRGSAHFGPHRDDLGLSLDGRPARTHGSQGQQRLLTLALKLAELSCVRSVALVHPILLLDDVSSELDAERTKAVFQFLRETESQVFVTTTRPTLFSDVDVARADRADFKVQSGQIERVLSHSA